MAEARSGGGGLESIDPPSIQPGERWESKEGNLERTALNAGCENKMLLVRKGVEGGAKITTVSVQERRAGSLHRIAIFVDR